MNKVRIALVSILLITAAHTEDKEIITSDVRIQEKDKGTQTEKTVTMIASSKIVYLNFGRNAVLDRNYRHQMSTRIFNLMKKNGFIAEK